jgi:hypothetical protein
MLPGDDAFDDAFVLGGNNTRGYRLRVMPVRKQQFVNRLSQNVAITEDNY